MPPTLKITGCVVDEVSFTISFSAPVDPSATDTGAANPDNFTIYDPAVPGFAVPTSLDSTWSSVISIGPLDPNHPAKDPFVTWNLPDGTSFNAGDFVLITVSDIALASAPGASALIGDPVSLSREVPGTGTDDPDRTARNVEDAVSYPVLTEEIGYRPSPVGMPSGGGGYGGGGGGGSIGQMAMKAVSDVLGWKSNNTDPKGFIGALTQSFTLTDVEGHVESTWTPRTYAVQTDLGGGITGAQASLYTRAKDALDQCLSLLDGLYPLDPEADPEYVKALREMARSQMTEIVKELGMVGLPSILRIDTYFGILLGQNPAQLVSSGTQVEFDPDEIGGTLETLRDTYGIYFEGNPFNNTVEDEQDITNFRVISDYMTSLLQSWIANRDFFRLASKNPAFFGTQLVLISRQFNVIIETVNEARFTLDSVFIGPNERQTLLLEFNDSQTFPPMFLEDVFNEVEKFATDEGPRLLRDGGKISVTNNLLPVVDTLAGLINQAHRPANAGILPDGFRTARVQKSLDDLEDQLNALIVLVQQVEQQVPPSEDRIEVSGVNPTSGSKTAATQQGLVLHVYGDDFDPAASVSLTLGSSSLPFLANSASPNFYSAQRIDVTLDLTQSPVLGFYDVTVTNPDGDSVTLPSAFQVTNGAGGAAGGGGAGGGGGAMMKRALLPAGKAGAKTIASPPKPTPPAPPAPAPAVSALQGQIQQLQKSHDALTKGHEDIKQKLDDMWDKMTAFFEGTNKDKKDKGD